MAQDAWEADKMLDTYIYDYLLKHNLQDTAKAFRDEAHVSPEPVSIDAPGSFLFEWWSVFWDMFVARTNAKRSDVAISYLEQQSSQQQIQMQQLMLQNHAQQQHCNVQQQLHHQQQEHLQHHRRQQKQQHNDDNGKQSFNGNSGQLLHSNPPSMLMSASVSAQAFGQIIQGSISDTPGSLTHAQDIKAETNMALNSRTLRVDGSLTGVGVLGSNQVGNNLTLKGWPLTGLEQLRSGSMNPPQASHHLHFLTLQQQQQQCLLQARESMASSPVDMDSRRLMLYSGGTSFLNIGSTVQCMGSDMLMKKKIAAVQQHQQTNNQQQLLHHPLLIPQPQSSNHHANEQEKMMDVTIAMHGSSPNSFHGNEQVFKNQSGRKRKQSITPFGPANGTGTTYTAGPSRSSSPSTPSAQSSGDTVSTLSLHHNADLSKALVVYGDNTSGSMGSPTSQPVRYGDDFSLNDNIFCPHDEVSAMNPGSHRLDADKGSILQEISSAQASSNKVLCCHFSSDGKLLATGGHDKKVVLWNAETLKKKSILKEHTALISDVRFSPSIQRLATSSSDKTIRVWDTNKLDYSVRMFAGHDASVKSIDFHPVKDDLICSCDRNNEMRFWSINMDRAVLVAQGASNQLRFQPHLGGYLAASSDNVVSILDAETLTCMRRFEGHLKRVDSLCWDPTGEYVVSVSEDAVKVWSLKMGNSVHELKCTGSKFRSCAFHPSYPFMLIIGCHQSLELWDMSENMMITIPAHEDLITSLAVSNSGMVASTGHDKYVKLWGSMPPLSVVDTL